MCVVLSSFGYGRRIQYIFRHDDVVLAFAFVDQSTTANEKVRPPLSLT